MGIDQEIVIVLLSIVIIWNTLCSSLLFYTSKVQTKNSIKLLLPRNSIDTKQTNILQW